MALRLSIIAVFYTAKQKKRKKICICAIFVVPLHTIVLIWEEKINTRGKKRDEYTREKER